MGGQSHGVRLMSALRACWSEWSGALHSIRNRNVTNIQIAVWKKCNANLFFQIGVLIQWINTMQH